MCINCGKCFFKHSNFEVNLEVEASSQKMRNTSKVNRVTRILLMDQRLPRVPSKSHIISSAHTSSPVLPLRTSTCAFSSANLNLLSSSPPIPLLATINLNSRDFSVSSMENYSQEKSEEEVKLRQREGYGKSSNDPLGRGSDDILPHILNLYGSCAKPEDFEIYAPDASFEDPLMRAEGVKQIKSAFYSLSKIFSESRIVEYSVKEEEISPGNKEILIDNKQYYKFLGKDINMVSLIKLQIRDGKVVRHEDWWDKKPLWNRDTVKLPLVGRVTEMTRRASMFATHALMGFGKDHSN